MTRSYRHIQEYEKEIIELKSKGYTKREISHTSLQSKGALFSIVRFYWTCSAQRGSPLLLLSISEPDSLSGMNLTLFTSLTGGSLPVRFAAVKGGLPEWNPKISINLLFFDSTLVYNKRKVITKLRKKNVSVFFERFTKNACCR